MFGLGIDAGGTQTRWALSLGDEIAAEGSASGLTALQLGSASGREAMRATLAEIARGASAHGRIARVVAGMTGFDGGPEKDTLAALVAESFGIAPSNVTLSNDVEIAYHDLFAPGAGYLVYAGTGTIGVFVDASRTFHRVGGLGGILDDAGGGYWIAIQALRHVWREEDEGRTSPLAKELFSRIGGESWDATRDFVYSGGFEANRGKIGKLALAVAAADDPKAREILAAAGEELARIGRIFLQRFGKKPIAVAGRAIQLHPIVEQTMRAALPDVEITLRHSDAHVAAARIAGRTQLESPT